MGEGSTAYELKILQVKSLHVVQDYSKGHLLVQTHNRSHTTGLAARRISVFGHITRLESDVPTHMALRRHIDLSVGRPPSPNWRRRPDRPRARWIDQIRRDSSSSPVELWRRAIRRGRGRWSYATAPIGYAILMIIMSRACVTFN